MTLAISAKIFERARAGAMPARAARAGRCSRGMSTRRGWRAALRARLRCRPDRRRSRAERNRACASSMSTRVAIRCPRDSPWRRWWVPVTLAPPGASRPRRYRVVRVVEWHDATDEVLDEAHDAADD